MALNPFFLQGSGSEQNLIQQLVNEQLKIFGVEVSYLPQKFIKKETILREVTASKFDDNFSIEAYISNFDGYAGSGDILSKFGMNLKDELTLIISKERFEDFISPFLSITSLDEIIVSSRPREGDLIYFPLGNRLFEIKFVEHEQPFYQLGKTYVYELKCELFEYSDNVGGWDNLNTTVEEIDKTLENQGYITTLKLFPSGSQAIAEANLESGYVRKIDLINDGYNYKTSPTVEISSAPTGGITAQAVAITSCIGNFCSVKEILLVNPGAGYTMEPTVTISSSTGIGATARAVIEKTSLGIGNIVIINNGSGYVSSPIVQISSPTISGISTYTSEWTLGAVGNLSYTFIGPSLTGAESNPPLYLVRGQQYKFTNTMGIHPFRIQSTPNGSIGTQYDNGIVNNNVSNGTLTWNVPFNAPNILYYQCTAHESMGGKIYITSVNVGSAVTAVARAIVNSQGLVDNILISDAGIGYTSIPPISISNPPLLVGINTYIFNEVVIGESSGSKSRVKSWDEVSSTLKVGIVNGDFIPGEIIVGSISSARYPLQKYEVADLYDKYEQNDEIQIESNSIVDFSESNLFGNY
jgi:hypothetical protein